MIKTGYTVRVGFPKHVSNNEKTVFKVGCKDRNFDQNKLWHNVSFMTDFIDVQDKEEVEITEITGFSVNDYQGKPQFTVYGSVVKPTEQTHEQKQPTYEPEEVKQTNLGISPDDLPF